MKKLLLILLCGVTLFACQKEQQKTIILSKASSNYVKWIEDENVIILDAYTIKNTDSILALADGIILTGGEDINPLEYNDTANIKVCGPINFSRDTHFKFRIFTLYTVIMFTFVQFTLGSTPQLRIIGPGMKL